MNKSLKNGMKKACASAGFFFVNVRDCGFNLCSPQVH